ncbi:MAG: hypothetical protein JST55_10665 [Bacteroidetes bacterium]|nr:hypothetical protein [Bacteroidota bacterium]
MKLIFLYAGLLILNTSIAQDLTSKLPKNGIYIAKNFTDNVLTPADVIVSVPDTGNVQGNLLLSIGYNFFSESPRAKNFLILKDVSLLGFMQFEHTTDKKTPLDKNKIGVNLGFNFFDIYTSDNKSQSFRNSLISSLIKDNIDKNNDAFSLTYIINPDINFGIWYLDWILPSTIVPEFVLGIANLKYYNRSSIGINFQPNNNNPQFENYTTIFANLNPGLVYLINKNLEVALDVSYSFGKKFDYDYLLIKYYNFLKMNLAFYFLKVEESKFGVAINFVKGQNLLENKNYDKYIKISLVTKLQFPAF